MSMIIFFFLLSSSLFAGLFTHIKPPAPGLYDVTIDEDGEVTFDLIQKPSRGLEKVKAAGDEITAWDFRLVTSCSAINTVRDQKSCGGCWAFASTDVYGSALCLNDNKNYLFSPQYLIDCPDTQTYGGHQYTQQGCQGGYPIIAFMTFNKTGTGGGCPTWSCRPFTGSKNKCPTTCTDTSNLNSNKIRSSKVIKYVDAYQVDLQTLRNLVVTSGPVVAEMKVYSDLSSYTSGVYEHKVKGDFEGHAITIYGFGTENQKNYWLVKNSWGASWGDGGYFKIRMGLNESGIEDNFYALYNNAAVYTTAQVPRPTQTEPGKYWNFEDVPNCPLIPTQAECEITSGCLWETDTTTSSNSRGHTQANTEATEPEPVVIPRLRSDTSSSSSSSSSSSLRRAGNALDCYDTYCTGSIPTNPCDGKEAVCKQNSSCLWYDFVSPEFCDDWDYDCQDVQTDVPGFFPTCEAGGSEFGITCTTTSTGPVVCTPNACRDIKKSTACGNKSGCKWYNYSTRYYPFCSASGVTCGHFQASDCNFADAYGLTCEVVNKTCVGLNAGKCVNGATALAIPTTLATLLLSVVVLLMTVF